mgnify:CR=1 FL=1
MSLLVLPSCLLQHREPESATPAAAGKKKAQVAERWQTVGGGMLGVSLGSDQPPRLVKREIKR